MGKGKKIGIGIGVSVVVFFLIFGIMYQVEVEEGAQTVRFEVVWNDDNQTFDFTFFFSDRDGSPVRASGEMKIEIVSRSIENYVITEQITFEKDEFLAYQNNFGATIIELKKEILSEPFVNFENIRDIKLVPIYGSFDVYVDIKTSVRSFSFDPITLSLN